MILLRTRQALPVRPFAGALLVRASVLWVLVRMVFALLDLRFTQALSRPPLVTVFAIVLLSVVLGLIDVRRRGENVLLTNLGIGTAALAAVLLAPPVLLEILMALATGL